MSVEFVRQECEGLTPCQSLDILEHSTALYMKTALSNSAAPNYKNKHTVVKEGCASRLMVADQHFWVGRSGRGQWRHSCSSHLPCILELPRAEYFVIAHLVPPGATNMLNSVTFDRRCRAPNDRPVSSLRFAPVCEIEAVRGALFAVSAGSGD